MLLSSGREMRNRRMPHGKAHHRSDTPPFQNVMAMSKAAVAPSTMHRRPQHSPRQRSVLAAFGSNTSTRGSAKAGSLAQMALEPKLIECLIVEGAKFRVKPRRVRISPSCATDDVNDETEPSPSGKLEAILGFTLYLNERISGRERGSWSGVRSCTPQR